MVDADLPSGWHRIESKSHKGKVYFFNEFSRVSRWTKPEKEEYEKPKKIRCHHILVKHNEVRNPKSKRTQVAVKRTRAEALTHTEDLRKKLKTEPEEKLKEKLMQLAEAESDCNTFKRGGDLGAFTKKVMQEAFSKPAFALKEGELSGVIESDSGFHIILRVPIK
mmetsp:Transcript_9005/g.11295  ORF Transcript_9005/g.11295 Transcript_9005/m.11295 type:complete len:165 (+) Transcript_9005:267-761(+)|eukprot:CAMPEP_0204825290 /NCGR_PEP_ID=MMETSP1346-20131115/3207_1 /ASSEMBLY_ACC=CAM_ASM_000771 /TAXON_ID=215587 /ORGANISM="Aplanochytrium stocchinoi, Strain GSBS06" /LENGTH=164 /DNA_ID=CAMNT_0051952871 /DNA_START=204 /DNA_END=698 /DNA_ORIENTATION=-